MTSADRVPATATARKRRRRHDSSLSGVCRYVVLARAARGGFDGYGFGKKFEDSDDDYDASPFGEEDDDGVIDVGQEDYALREKLNIELKSRGVDPNLPKLAAPGLLKELRDKRPGGKWARFGSSFQIAVALIASVVIWNLPKLVAAAAASLAANIPALAPIVVGCCAAHVRNRFDPAS